MRNTTNSLRKKNTSDDYNERVPNLLLSYQKFGFGMSLEIRSQHSHPIFFKLWGTER
jgi:hypothetical protein